MSIIQVNHIQSSCQSRFASLIDLDDVKDKSADEKQNHFLTRSLAAFAVAALAKVDDAIAANSVVDEFHDNGIDAFYFDRTEHRAYLVQSKWVKNGSNGIDLGSVLKFIQGINHFLESKIDDFGPKMRAKKSDIQDALSDSQATFAVVIASTGKPGLAAEVKAPLDQLLADLNDDGELVSLVVLKQKELHDIVEQRALGDSVDLTIMLHEYGKVREPYAAYYGQVDAADIVTWGKFGDRLYHRNIRGFKGSTEVNESIVATLKNKPENFLYFNNGITLLCSEVEKQPLGGKARLSGVFDCKGASVVNGAQTVGSIIAALSPTPSDDSQVPSGRVMVRIISLKNCPASFGFDVTKATNTQNKIEKRDFAALDEEQGRLRSDMLLSLAKEYVFRTGDKPPDREKGCTLDEAAVALACADHDITNCMIAKREVSRLYDDIQKAPYKVLFNSGLSALKLWRAVLVLRAVEDFLKQEQASREGRERLVAIHGNRFLLHLVFRELPSTFFDNDDASEEMQGISGHASTCLNRLTAKIITEYSSSYPGQLFKNITKCKAIAAALAGNETSGAPIETVNLL